MALFVENNRSLCNTVLWGQSTTLVPNTANRGSDVGKMSPKLMPRGEGWGGGGVGGCLALFIDSLLYDVHSLCTLFFVRVINYSEPCVLTKL